MRRVDLCLPQETGDPRQGALDREKMGLYHAKKGNFPLVVRLTHQEWRLRRALQTLVLIIVIQAGLNKVDVKGGVFLIDAGIRGMTEPVSH